MSKFKGLVVSLPLLVIPLGLAMSSVVKAETVNVGPSGAVKLLSQSNAVNGKCNYLPASQKSELSGYLAKAEIAAASMDGTRQARTARKQGAKLGKQMACNSESQELVAATLDAARRAMRAAVAQKKRSRVKTAKRRPAPYVVKKVKIDPSLPRATIFTKKGSLTRYRKLTAAYYLERRCQHLSRAQAVDFWKRIVARHNAVLSKYSTSQVAKAKRDAETAANAQGACGARTAQIVRAGYAG